MRIAASQCFVDPDEPKFGPFWMLWLKLEKQDKLKIVTPENKQVICQLMMSKKEDQNEEEQNQRSECRFNP